MKRAVFLTLVCCSTGSGCSGESTTNDVDTGIADLRSGEEASASTDSSSSPDTGADS
ncbi:MAG: hypothetical protein JRH20_08140, partial [Deltaproteobacteria bacterium]|nr:hypothetical protein [Deltaproteobacteria bacterium]